MPWRRTKEFRWVLRSVEIDKERVGHGVGCGTEEVRSLFSKIWTHQSLARAWIGDRISLFLLVPGGAMVFFSSGFLWFLVFGFLLVFFCFFCFLLFSFVFFLFSFAFVFFCPKPQAPRKHQEKQKKKKGVGKKTAAPPCSPSTGALRRRGRARRRLYTEMRAFRLKKGQG